MEEKNIMDMNYYCYNGKKAFSIKKFDCDSTGEFTNREEAVDEIVAKSVDEIYDMFKRQ